MVTLTRESYEVIDVNGHQYTDINQFLLVYLQSERP